MQQSFDFDRAEQLGMLKHWQPPRRKGIGAASCKHVLRIIDSYGWGKSAWPSEKTIARDSGLSLSTVKRAVKALLGLSVIITDRKNSQTLNFYTIVWTELALLCNHKERSAPAEQQCVTMTERRVTAAERSVTMRERSVMVPKRSVTMTERSIMVTPEHKEEYTKETTTTRAGGCAVVVAVNKILAKGDAAVRKARERGASDDWILARCREWRDLPDDRREPGTLFNWLAIDGSYRAPKAAIEYGRGDGMSRDEVQAAALRVRIVRAGRAAGATAEQIEQRLHAAGV